MVHVYWYLGRSSGFVAYWLLSSSVVLGLLVSSRRSAALVSPGWVVQLHEFTSLLVILLAVFHAFVMLPDPYAGFTLAELLVPLHSHLQPVAMSLGIVGLYATALLAGTFYIRRFIGQRTWRLLHYLTFGAFALVTAHGLLLGTDSRAGLALVSYIVTVAVVAALIVYRVMSRHPGGKSSSSPSSRRVPNRPAEPRPRSS